MILEPESEHVIIYLHKGHINPETDMKRFHSTYQKFACDTIDDELPSDYSVIKV